MELSTNVKTGDLKITSPEAVTPVAVTTEKKPEPDLITRVSQFKPEVKQTEVAEPEFDFKDIEKIEDPKAKEYAEKAYKSFQKGFNQKFQEIAELRKGLESEKSRYSNWTPERIQQALNDPEFVKSAQQVAASQAPQNFQGSQEDWSGLSDTDKAKFSVLEQKLAYMEQQNFQARKSQEDEQLKTKYANYNPQALDILTADLLAGKVQATREYLYKAANHDDNVKNAYQLGLQDGQQRLKEKASVHSPEGVQVTSSGEVPKKDPKESSSTYFGRLYLNALTKLKSTDSIK